MTSLNTSQSFTGILSSSLAIKWHLQQQQQQLYLFRYW